MKKQLLVAGALALVPMSVAVAGSGLHHMHGHDAGDPREHIEEMLDAVDATDAQREAVAPLVERATVSTQEIHARAAELHEQLLGILTADTIDRAALEQVRTQGVALVDDASRDLL